MKKLKALSIYQLRLQIRDYQAMFFLIGFPVIMYVIFSNLLKGVTGYNGKVAAIDYLIPSYLPIIIINGGIMMFGLMLTVYKEKNYFIKYKLLGFKPLEIAISVSITIIICEIIGIISLVLFAYFINNITIPINNIVNVLLTILIITAFQFSLGYFLSSIFRKSTVYQTVALIVFYFEMFLGGLTFPPEMFGASMRRVLEIINPIIHGLYMIRGTWIEGKSVLNYPLECGILLGVTGLLCLIASIIDKSNYAKSAY